MVVTAHEPNLLYRVCYLTSTIEIPLSRQVWGAEPGSVWFVGDSIDDMVCGKLAGCKTCLIITEDNEAVAAQTEYVDLAVHSLRDFGSHIGLD